MNSATKHIVKDVTFNRSELNESKPFSLGFRNHDEKDITELADHERKVFEESPQAAAADDEEEVLRVGGDREMALDYNLPVVFGGLPDFADGRIGDAVG